MRAHSSQTYWSFSLSLLFLWSIKFSSHFSIIYTISLSPTKSWIHSEFSISHHSKNVCMWEPTDECMQSAYRFLTCLFSSYPSLIIHHIVFRHTRLYTVVDSRCPRWFLIFRVAQRIQLMFVWYSVVFERKKLRLRNPELFHSFPLSLPMTGLHAHPNPLSPPTLCIGSVVIFCRRGCVCVLFVDGHKPPFLY